MKRIITLLMCSIMALGIGGCSNNTEQRKFDDNNLSNEEFYNQLIEDGYTFDISSYGTLTIDGKYTIEYIDMNLEDVGIEEDNSSVSLYSDDVKVYISLNLDTDEKEVVSLVSADNNCSVYMNDELYNKYGSSGSDCTSTNLKDSENSVDSAYDIFNELKIDDVGLYKFCKWYYEENADTIENEDYTFDEDTSSDVDSENETTSDSMTLGQENAYYTALDYLDYTSFSKQGLIEQLEYEGYTTEEAEFAVEKCNVDWGEQAELMAQDYMEYDSFSRQGLLDQLLYEGFTQEEAEQGVKAVGY